MVEKGEKKKKEKEFCFWIDSNRLPDSVEYGRTGSAMGWASTTTLEVIKYPRKPVGWFLFRHRQYG